MTSLMNFIKHLRNNANPKHALLENRRWEHFKTHFMRPAYPDIKVRQKHQRKESHRLVSLMNIDTKNI